MLLHAANYCADLVERRINDFVGLDARSAFDELVQVLHNSWIAVPGIGFGILVGVPPANPNSFRFARSEERNFAFKACLLSKHRNASFSIILVNFTELLGFK